MWGAENYGIVVVSASYNNVPVIERIHGLPPFYTRISLIFFANYECKVKILLFSLAGELAAEVNAVTGYGMNSVEWGGKNKNGSEVPAGIYVFRIYAECGDKTKIITGKAGKIY